MPHVDDTADLLQRVEAGASVRTIAAELDVTERTVRNRLRRAGVPLPSTLRYADVDLGPILGGYRAGVPVATLAAEHGVGTAWLHRRIADSGVERDVPMRPRRRAPRYPEVADRRWLLERIARGDSIYAAAKELRTSRQTIERALERHGLTWPPASADPVERLAYVDDDEIRRAAAQRITDDAEALAERARAVLRGSR